MVLSKFYDSAVMSMPSNTCSLSFRAPKSSSRGPRDGSSGYDSSDNETANQYKNNRKYRSDPDFRMQNVHPSYHAQGVGPLYPKVSIIHYDFCQLVFGLGPVRCSHENCVPLRPLNAWSSKHFGSKTFLNESFDGYGLLFVFCACSNIV